MNAEVSKFPKLTRRRSLASMASLLAMGAFSVPAVQAAHGDLPLSASLADELAQALEAGQPLVVMVSLPRCPWCDVVREHYLNPMREREGLRVVQVEMLGKQSTQDVSGQSLSHGQLVRQWEVKIAPTLLFLGDGGQEVAKRLEGGGSDFYSAYLDQRLEQAREAVSS